MDVQVTISFNKGPAVNVTAQALDALPIDVARGLRSSLRDVARRLEYMTILEYILEGHNERPRVEGEPLLERMMSAMRPNLRQYGPNGTDHTVLHFFDLDKIAALTMNEGDRTKNRGWWEFFNDEHAGEAHYSTEFGFLPLEYAKELATECAVAMKLTQGEATDLMVYVEQHFGGRHGQGIMVKLALPMFNDYPDFGKAGKFVKPHPGYKSWELLNHVFSQITGGTGEGLGGGNWIGKMIDDAFDQAEKKAGRPG